MRILYVEDNPDVTEIVTELFGQNGCVVYHAKSAAEALELLLSNEFDLVFSDIRLGAGDNGVVLAEQIQNLYPRLLVVLTTGYAALPVEGISDWTIIHKPFNVDELMTIFADMLADSHRVEPPAPPAPPEPPASPVMHPEPVTYPAPTLGNPWQRFVAMLRSLW